MENKKPIRVAAYIRVGNASQLTHKETPVMNNTLDTRVNTSLNAKRK